MSTSISILSGNLATLASGVTTTCFCCGKFASNAHVFAFLFDLDDVGAPQTSRSPKDGAHTQRSSRVFMTALEGDVVARNRLLNDNCGVMPANVE